MNFSERRNEQRTICLKLILGDSILKKTGVSKKKAYEGLENFRISPGVVGGKENIRKMRAIKVAQMY